MLFLAQLVALPLHSGPVRLPKPVQQARQRLKPIFRAPFPKAPPPLGDKNNQNKSKNSNLWAPEVIGLHPYLKSELIDIFDDCIEGNIKTVLNKCAAALTTRLVSDGYVNSRVYAVINPEPGSLEVEMGRISELQISSSDDQIKARVEEELGPLLGTVLHLPTLEKALVKLRRGPVGEIKGGMSRLGSDPSKAAIKLSIDPAGPTPLKGEFMIGNGGNMGSGEWRSVGTLVQNDFIRWGDTAMLFTEFNFDGDPEIGNKIFSATYTWPFDQDLSLTGSLGYSRSQLVEFVKPARNLSFRNFQGLLQLDKTILTSDMYTWTASAGLSASRSDSYESGDHIGLVAGGGEEGWSRGGHLKLSSGVTGLLGQSLWAANIYALQGLAGITHDEHLHNLDLSGIEPGKARVFGGSADLSWPIVEDVKLNFRTAGQVAFNQLPSSMTFSLGSGNGLRGLPGSMISGENGWLSQNELVWTAWKKEKETLELIPFLGFGSVETTILKNSYGDEIGSGGILARYTKEKWEFELGWVDSFRSKNNSGLWNDWVLGHGLHTNLRFSF